MNEWNEGEATNSTILVNTSSESTFRIMEAIGTSSRDGITVYRAERAEPFYRSPFVTIMYVDKDKDRAIFENLKQQLYKTNRPYLTDNILKPWPTFFHNRYYCVAFSYMEHGSLLSLMAKRFSRGFPEKCIIFFLYRIIHDLSQIHQCSEVHGEVSAAHVFISQQYWIRIRPMLAYAGSVHHLLEDEIRDSCSSYMPATSVCRWAEAPEKRSSSRADIWSVGITALELAYGGLRLKSRAELESLVKKMQRKNKLPKKLNDDDELEKKRPLSLSLPLPFQKKRITPTGFEHRHKERVFSKGFVDLVLSCLKFNPDKRPTADDLRRRKIFARARAELDFLL
ncbi:hypothetical protein C2S53_004168 [Perilla frutescens var. hirtella]|uniref:Protein kinase domain-containing protein n=1 Tax=Perilla frutescens var. hirtella TaxID=608512 RepID=A0AAD4JIE5_PERFH|nr:hypothetical protein C2S53_004168 [Perilla frutescens var. hirtella]